MGLFRYHFKLRTYFESGDRKKVYVAVTLFLDLHLRLELGAESREKTINKMPFIELQTNLPASSFSEDFVKKLCSSTAAALGKPEEVSLTFTPCTEVVFRVSAASHQLSLQLCGSLGQQQYQGLQGG